MTTSKRKKRSKMTPMQRKAAAADRKWALHKNHVGMIEGRELQEIGMARAAAKNPEVLKLGRKIMFDLALNHPDFEVTIDDVRLRFDQVWPGDLSEISVGVWGSVVRWKPFRKKGEMRRSSRPTNHRPNEIWILKEGYRR